MKHFNQLTPAQAERLALLLEEVGEAIQVVGKVLRHGYQSTHPNDIIINRSLLECKLGDVRAAMILLCDSGDLDKATIHAAADDKLKRVKKWMHHQ